ncbi:MAG: hypothetical protein WHX52_05055 [Anaerolineae bacterium]
MKRRWLILNVVLLSLIMALPASTQTKSVLVNGGFETALNEWQILVAGTLTRTTTAPHSGSYAAQVDTTADDGYGWAYQCIDLSSHLATWPTAPDGKKYLTLDGYVKSDGEANVALEIEFYTGINCTNPISETQKSSIDTNSVNWTLLSVTDEITDTAVSVTANFWGYTLNSVATTFYADDLRVFSSASVNAVQLQGLKARAGLWSIGLASTVLVGTLLLRRRRVS